MASKIYSVTQLNQEVKALLERNLPFRNIFVQGEISNYKAHSSGQHYLTLKDEDAAINAVMFRSDAMRLRFRLQNGMKVIARGRISSFPKSGQVQFYIADMMPDGAGALHTAFEQIKKQLEEEGLFSEAHKLPLPTSPKTIALITAPTGAAVHDMIRILQRRWPIAKIQIYPALVQGTRAPDDLCRALREVNAQAQAEVVIIGRGGGSLEELWAFNSEVVARAIYASNIPVISAVGHEPDVTIADYVADLRAPTPSAAAELVAPDMAALQLSLQHMQHAIKASLTAKIHAERQSMSRLSQRLSEHTPFKRIESRRMALAQAMQRLSMCSPQSTIQTHRISVNYLQTKLQALADATFADNRKRLTNQVAKLDALSPLKVLARGYTVSYDEEKQPITNVAALQQGQAIQVQFMDGTAKCTVTEIEKAGRA